MKAGVRELDESISDAAIAEIEAGIYGLQVKMLMFYNLNCRLYFLQQLANWFCNYFNYFETKASFWFIT